MLNLILLILAADNVADMLTNLDLLAWPREIVGKIPFLGKIASCKYCQTFWLLAFGVYYYSSIPNWIILWLALHRAAQVVGEFVERYTNRAPLTIMSITDKN